MDQKVEIKVETVWLEERADNYELLSEETHLKEETKSELAEPGQTQVKTFELFADVKDEIFKEEHTGGQLHASSKDGDNLENSEASMRGLVHSFDSCCELLKTESELMCYLPTNSAEQSYHYNDFNQKPLSHAGEMPFHHEEILTPMPNIERVPLNGERPTQCNECGKIFSRKALLERHLLIHSGLRPHRCIECSRTFSQKGNLKRHLLTHTAQRLHWRKECVAKSGSETICDLPTDSTKQSYHCNVCNKRPCSHKGEMLQECKEIFTNPSQIEVVPPNEERPHQCNECGKIFSRKALVERHLLIHSGERPYRCTYCTRSFSQKGNLKRHLLTHTGARLRFCNGCGGKPGSDLPNDSTEQSYLCSVCNKSLFSYKEEIPQKSEETTARPSIIQGQSPNEERPHQCSECGKSFSRKDILKKHMLIHTGERPHQCNECSRTFAHKFHLKKHMLTHSDLRPHTCNECGRTFRLKFTLKMHLLSHPSHSADRQHRCSDCGKAFSQKSNLERHMLSHRQERSHLCYECGKAFFLKSHLDTHLISHSQEKPFCCRVCSKMFTRKSYLNNHMRHHSHEVLH